MVSRIDDFGTPEGVQPLRGRLGARDGHALSVDEAGRVALGRHAQRDDRPLAERDRGEGRDPLAVPPRDRRRADRPGGGRCCPSRTFVNGIQQRPAAKVSSMAYSFDDADASDRHTTQYFEMFVQPRHLSQGMDGRDPAQHPVGARRKPAARRRRLGALRSGRLDAGARPRRQISPAKLQELQRLFLIEADEVQRAPARRSASRAIQRRPGRSPAARQWELADPVRRDGTPERELYRRHEEQVVRDHGPGRCPERRRERGDRRAGRSLRRPEPLREGREAGVLLQPVRAAAVQGRRRCADPAGRASGAHGVHVRRGRPRQGRRCQRCSWTASRSARDGSTPPCRCSSRRTRPPTSGRTARRPVSDDYGPRDSEFTGRIRWVQIDIDEAAEDLDHLITDEERLRIAMARQ